MLPALCVPACLLETYPRPCQDNTTKAFDPCPTTCVSHPTPLAITHAKELAAGPASMPMASALKPGERKEVISQYLPQSRSSPAWLVREWPNGQGKPGCPALQPKSVASFQFDLKCKFLSFPSQVPTCPPPWLMLCIIVNLNLQTSVYEEPMWISMRQIEDPNQTAHFWPPPQTIRWEFKAGTKQNYDPERSLDLVLELQVQPSSTT